MFLRNILLTLMAAAALTGPVAAREPGQPFKPGFNLFSKEQDVQAGQQAAQQVRQQYQVVDNPALQDYVRRVGNRLANTPTGSDSGFKFTFTVLNDASVNAFALPGGPMFIFTGLLKAVDNEAQLAGVMAHEMSHVILRHGTHEASKAQAVQVPAALLGAILGRGTTAGQLANMGLGLGANSVILKFSRDAESEADAMGVHIMAEAGYDPAQLAQFFRKLEASGGQGNSTLAQFLSDHPNPGNRERAIMDEAATIRQRNYGFSTGDFQRAKADVAALPAPPKRNVQR
jgi:predicted Zn-dependent protease